MEAVPKRGKYLGALVEYLDGSKLRPGLVLRDHGRNLALLDLSGRERLVAPDLILVVHHNHPASPETFAEAAAAIDSERARLAKELDLNLLWEVVQEQPKGFSAEELAELFFGRRSTVAAAVMLEALLNDRLYFVRRHLEFIARSPEQVVRLRVQHEKERLRGESARRMRLFIRDALTGSVAHPPIEDQPLVEELRQFLANPSTRSRELETLLMQASPETGATETCFEILLRLGAIADCPRFTIVGNLPSRFSPESLAEAQAALPAVRPAVRDELVIAIDDKDTLEVDDALSCTALGNGSLRVRVHIALVSDFVAQGGPMDGEAAERATTVYLPEGAVRMLPDEISCCKGSLLAGQETPCLTTEITLGPAGELLQSSIYPASVTVGARLSYDEVDSFLAARNGDGRSDETATLRTLHAASVKLAERRRQAGAALVQRREPKVTVSDGKIEISVIDNQSPARQLVAEFMVLSNHVAARFAADARVPIIYRTQPGGGDLAPVRARLSLYPEYHAGVGLSPYAQLSSPIRRYADLVLQRQLIAALGDPNRRAYGAEELLRVLADSEAAEGERKELERRAKRYWILRYLDHLAEDCTFSATAWREGATAELLDFATRGTLQGAPFLENATRVAVRIGRVDPFRGTLVLQYAGLEGELGRHDKAVRPSPG
jgi:exoribonuclease II